MFWLPENPGCLQETYENLRSRLKCAEMPTNGTCAILFDEGE
jgi:hypothetical protein